ncbi:hypothetical protein KY312_04060, partial [Candidatus Woesearchaeota archaeon]|nr:hypothetical protein [Candidatus Woesearchaeota archaeon]
MKKMILLLLFVLGIIAMSGAVSAGIECCHCSTSTISWQWHAKQTYFSGLIVGDDWACMESCYDAGMGQRARDIRLEEGTPYEMWDGFDIGSCGLACTDASGDSQCKGPSKLNQPCTKNGQPGTCKVTGYKGVYYNHPVVCGCETPTTTTTTLPPGGYEICNYFRAKYCRKECKKKGLLRGMCFLGNPNLGS